MTNICVITTYNNKSIPLYPGVSWSILQSSPDKNTLLGDSQDRLTRSLIGLSPWENLTPIGRGWCGSTYACSGYFSASNYSVLNILWESPVSLQWQFLSVPWSFISDSHLSPLSPPFTLHPPEPSSQANVKISLPSSALSYQHNFTLKSVKFNQKDNFQIKS